MWKHLTLINMQQALQNHGVIIATVQLCMGLFYTFEMYVEVYYPDHLIVCKVAQMSDLVSYFEGTSDYHGELGGE